MASFLAIALPPATPLLAALGAAAALQLVLWVISIRVRNAGLVDVGWAASIGGIGVGLALAGTSDPGRRWLLGAMVGIWAFRLTSHLLGDRVLGHPEEGRYVRLRAYWGRRANLWFLAFFQGQALLAALLAVPFAYAAFAPGVALGPLDIVAALVFVAAWSGEAIADKQLQRFRADPANKGKVCNIGLWTWSRHPNYFFEWLMWCAFALLALPAASGWVGLLSPLLILVFVLKLTGIPATEHHMLKTRGDAYRRYQATTSAFVPWPPRKEAVS
ncbi:MAG: DUF1295 domain-containing protein [Planctomycetota bacterium]|nr:DUF1295 domain-containing protein [Planctomycetota bacterium]